MAEIAAKGMMDVARSLRERTDSVLVSFSRGKDSLALLDLCKRLFKTVACFHMHLVPGLSFVEAGLACARRWWGVEVVSVPHWWLSHAFRQGTLRPISRTVPRISVRDVQAAMRERFGIEWVVSGERACDSLQRRGMMTRQRPTPGIDDKARVAYPLAWWTSRRLWSYIKAARIPLPPDYGIFGRSFSCNLSPRILAAMLDHYPEDFERVERVFPFARSAVVRWRIGQEAAQAAEQAGLNAAASGSGGGNAAPAQEAGVRGAEDEPG
jgi:phosphoadenosine phosphosulfate reductase